MLAVDLRNLTKRFGRVTAVNDLSLRIDSGEIVAFLGPNGAGKTTTIDMLLWPRTSGRRQCLCLWPLTRRRDCAW